MNRKIDAMHAEYGIDVKHQCKTCCNFALTRYNRTYRKCIAYGKSASKAADWTGKWFACGLYGKDFLELAPKRKTLIEALKRSSHANGERPIDGQLEF